MTLSRRRFLAGSVGSVAALGLAACSSGDTGMGGNNADRADSAPAAPAELGAKADTDTGPVTGTISFAFWGGSAAEQAGFEYAKSIFEKENPGATVNLKVSPYDGFYSGVDRSIQAGSAPDVFRVDYTTFGRYASKKVLLDMSPYYTQEEVDEFIPSFWNAVSVDGGARARPAGAGRPRARRACARRSRSGGPSRGPRRARVARSVLGRSADPHPVLDVLGDGHVRKQRVVLEHGVDLAVVGPAGCRRRGRRARPCPSPAARSRRSSAASSSCPTPTGRAW